ncbi:MAG TPA: tetratricopeptide repeat protein [Polyangiaceae bacterium]|nr:tetratricopeptide repeat protein [Polyangiaceae bacterium]
MTSAKDPLERALRLQRSGRSDEAASLYRQIISRNAHQHRALFSLGLLLFDNGRVEEASRYFERAVAVEPNPTYLTNLGETRRLLGRLDLAAEAFGRILEIAPDFPEARLNLAVTLAEAGVYREALALLEEALARGPDGPRLRVVTAWVLRRLNLPDGALVHAKRALELAPESPAAHRQLADALDSIGEKAAAIAAYRRAVELEPNDDGAHSELIVAMLSSPDCDDRALFSEARSWALRHAEPLRHHVRPLPNEKLPERPLRIGYVSPDFHAHALQQFLVPLFEQHDRSAFEIFLYASVDRPDSLTEWYRSSAGERFRDIRRVDDVRVAEMIRADRIDVLVDLALHSTGGRLRVFACKPAPVQISWLGYPGTTGLDTIDYRITDPFVDPPGVDLSVYSETCLHLPETLWCYAALAAEPSVTALPALDAGFVTFGCLNSFRKFHAGVFRLWARVLGEVPASRLVLTAEAHAHARLRAAFEREGVASERLEFAERTSRQAYLERYRRIDIGLDSFPYGGATTTLDAAWMGVPVVTLTGARALQRAGTCVATNLGLQELVAATEDDFVEIAAGLARDLARLSELRAGLRARLERSPLGDEPRFVRHLEAAYRTAWRRYCSEP